MRQVHLVGCASGLAGAELGCGQGPLVMRDSKTLEGIKQLSWQAMLEPIHAPGKRMDERVAELCYRLACQIQALVQQQAFFTVLGGDHSCAIGTWSGVQQAKGDIGLIWLDAHMDSHTPETTESGRIHGMPLASLMGYGYDSLTGILNFHPKLKPENICLIGVRSYEEGEAALLKRLNVPVFLMQEVEQRGLASVFDQAVELVTRNTVAYGLSLDLDGLDPQDAPAVDVPEPHGIAAQDLLAYLPKLAADPRLLGLEVVEFDPIHDKEAKTEQLIAKIIQAFI